MWASSLYVEWMLDEDAIARRFEAVRDQLDERGRRLLAATEARAAGRGGIAAVARERVPAIFLYWGDPKPYVESVHRAGTVLILQVGSVDEAKRAADAGFDIIIAQGWKAGGHVRGMTALMPLIPTVVDAVAPTPVVAAGGIADGRGLAAALALGAAGVCIGTRFIASDEAWVPEVYLGGRREGDQISVACECGPGMTATCKETQY